MDRYLNPKEKEKYPEWLEKQEERRVRLCRKLIDVVADRG